ncbi:respiratory nitrate reductase subunit gamma [Aquamicrobium defluvii]|uniref:nitrate reductase (quinone) n=1 Tax=Aquamicrobium defluvii TaxID=69279 RepID=A0A011V2I8_9HYPH|nr:respiratory nitrate reductase subunit gamma [Aquamicrobium defluvii]EXL02690.1 nitrate reductase [Aquamicrobium defluvii]EZQ13266.1 nitrate reductase [Halopseudomonas bauzanensis]
MNYLIFGVYPYIAITVMIAVSIVRYERDPFTWKSKSSQLLRKRQFIAGSVLFHVGILAIFAGHLVGLLTPIRIFDALGVSHEAKQLLAIGLGGVAGIMALVGGVLLLHRRLFDPRIRANSTMADTGIMVLLMAQLLLGLASIIVSLNHLDGEEMVKLMNWAQGVIYLRAGASDYITDVHWLFKAHIFLGLTIFLLFPFTRLVHMFSAPLRYLWRPGYQIVRSRRGAKPAPTGLKPLARTSMEPGK